MAFLEIDEGGHVRYRRHVGHAYTAKLLSAALDEGRREAIGSAARVLDERIALTRRLMDEDRGTGHTRLAETWARKLQEVEKQADVLRTAIRRVDEIARPAVEERTGRSRQGCRVPPRRGTPMRNTRCGSATGGDRRAG